MLWLSESFKYVCFLVTPGACHHKPTPNYLRRLLKQAGIGPSKAARLLDLSRNGLSNYLRDEADPLYRAASIQCNLRLSAQMIQQAAISFILEDRAMVQRLKTAKEGWVWLIKLAYMLFAFPCAVIVTIPSVFMAPSLIEQRVYPTLFFFAVIWLGVLIPVGAFIYGVLSRRRLLKKITAALRDSAYFNPDEICEMYHEGDGKYLGIDTKKGTILYVHKIRKGQVDVLGLTMSDWTNREVEGTSMFRLYTKLPELPRIEIATPWAQRWYDTLGAMEYKQKQYSTPQPFAQYVRDRLDALERKLNVHIQRLA